MEVKCEPVAFPASGFYIRTDAGRGVPEVPGPAGWRGASVL